MAENWPEYLRRITSGQTQTQIAEHIGIGRLSVLNWLHGKTQPKAETVITVAHAYRRSWPYNKSSKEKGPAEPRHPVGTTPTTPTTNNIAKSTTRTEKTRER